MKKGIYISEIWLKNADKLDFSAYPFCLPVIKYLKRLQFEKRVTFFVGENGSGKSTLLEAIAVKYGFNPEGGTKNFNFHTTETHSDLHKTLGFSKGVYQSKDGYFLRAESFYNLATEIERLDEQAAFSPRLIDSYGGVSLHNQSHGESFMSLILNRFGGNGIYILDEPEAALSPQKQLALLARIKALADKDSQFIIATHSPILLSYPDAEIYVFSDEGVFKTPYKETEHYIITKEFLNNPEKMLKYLMN